MRESQSILDVSDPDGGSQVPSTAVPTPIRKRQLMMFWRHNSAAEELGLIAVEKLSLNERYSCRRGKGTFNQAKAVIHSLSDRLQVPVPQEVVDRLLRQQLKRRSEISLELLAALSELLGLQTRIGEIRRDQMIHIDFPALTLSSDGPVLLHAADAGQLIVANPLHGICREKPEHFFDSEDQQLQRILLVVRNETTKPIGLTGSGFATHH